MISHNHSSQSAGSTPVRLPFGGLGFSLDTVREAAGSMTIAILPLEYAGNARAAFDEVPGLSGYGLLTALSREIRGR